MTQDIGQKIAVEFRNVTFSYSDKLCLNKISFKIHQGSHIAILGESGCGKSTVLKLIMGLYQVCSGEVLVFGKDIKNSDLNQIRNLISYVPQDPHLFPISILDNITCGHPMDHGQIIEACKAAQLNDFINSLPDGLNTNIGEYGNRLSGGERQRISIARAIAKNAPIYLLDEATSSLDGHTEQSILNYFHTNASERTVIFVTHRIKNTLASNLVICIKNGEIYEVGTPDMLLKTEGYYARLYRIQSLMEVCSNE